jgi:hypothetical protein
MSDLPPRFVPGSTGLPILSENRINGVVNETAVCWRLQGAGYNVANLNIYVMDNFPIADLVANNGKHRLLIQVRSAVADSAEFRLPAVEVERFEKLAFILDHRPVYAFVFGELMMHFCLTGEVVGDVDLPPEINPYLCEAELALWLDQMLSEGADVTGFSHVRAENHNREEPGERPDRRLTVLRIEPQRPQPL